MANNSFFSQPPIVGKRQQLLVAKPTDAPQSRDMLADLLPPITGIESLKNHLQTAIELEHSTIPPYLTALYSIKENTNHEAVAIIRSVVMEEMLHMILACNILNAVGGSPVINQAAFVPEYPAYLPHSDDSFLVNLEPFSKDCIETFMAIEKPAPPLAAPQAEKYHSIGQFYDAIKDALIRLDNETEGGIFIKDHARQITQADYYGAGGEVIAVHNLNDAILAINEIIGQGEGIDHGITDSDHALFGEEVEYAHYFRFNEIYKEQYYHPFDTPQSGPTGKPLKVEWEQVHRIKHNVKMNDFVKGTPEWEMMYDFNKTYCSLLNAIHYAVNHDKQNLMKAVTIMYELKYKAIALMSIPMGDGLFAGPSFEFVD